MASGNLNWKYHYKSAKEKISPVLQSKKGGAYSMVILSFLTMAFFGFFALRPTLRIIARLQREITDSRVVDDRLTRKIEALAQAQSDYELIKGAVPALNRALPTNPDIATVVSTVESIAQASQASISAFTISEVSLSTSSAVVQKTDEGGIPTIPMTFVVAGSYDQTLRFITLFVSNPRILAINHMVVLPSRLGENVQVQMSADAVAYYLQ